MEILHIVLKILILFFVAFLYRAGGSDQWDWCPIPQGMWRSFVGIPIGIFFALYNQSFIPLICILTYWFQPPYGSNSYLNFLGDRGKFAFCGLVFGISSIPALGLLCGIIQGIVSAFAFLVIKIFDDKYMIKNPWVERLRGFFGTMVCFFR